MSRPDSSSSEPGALLRLFPFMTAFIGWVRKTSFRGWLRRIGLGCGVVLAVGTILWQWENWKGRERVEAAKAALEQRGISLEFERYLIDQVPDGENAMKHAVWGAADWHEMEQGGWFFNPEAVFDWASEGVPRELLTAKGYPDLDEWQRVLRADPLRVWPATAGTAAADVLWASRSFGEFAEDMEEAFQRPHSQLFHYTLDDLEKGIVPQIPDYTDRLIGLRQLQWARVEAQLRQSDSEAAMRELLAPLYLAVPGMGQGTLVEALVRCHVSRFLTADIEQLILLPGWKSAELEKLQVMAHRFRVLEPTAKALERGLVWAVDALEKIWEQPEAGWAKVLDSDYRLMNFLMRWGRIQPQGWLDQNVAHLITWSLEDFVDPYDAERQRLFPERTIQEREYKITPHTFLVNIVHPQISSFYQSAAEAEAEWDLIEVLCAVRRYQLEKSEAPDALSDLIPEFIVALPHDYVSGDPMHYEKGLDGRITLATLDWDETGNPDDFRRRLELTMEQDPHRGGRIRVSQWDPSDRVE